MEKLYRVVITEVDPESKAEMEVHVDEFYQNVTFVGDYADCNKMTEIALHDSIFGIASKLASGEITSKAVRLAYTMMQIREAKAAESENSLLRKIMGE